MFIARTLAKDTKGAKCILRHLVVFDAHFHKQRIPEKDWAGPSKWIKRRFDVDFYAG